MKILLVFAALAVLQAAAVRRPSSERRLIKMLVQTSNRLGVRGRPVDDFHSSWNVSIGLALTHVHLDPRTQALDAAYWFTMGWFDQRLSWDKDHFDGVRDVRLNPSDITIPDIVAYNAIGRREEVSDVPLIVFSTGNVLWVNPLQQRFTCAIPPKDNLGEFNCTMKFGSWTYSKQGIDLALNSDSVETSYMTKVHAKYNLVSTSAVREEKTYPCCPEAYVSAAYTITFRPK